MSVGAECAQPQCATFVFPADSCVSGQDPPDQRRPGLTASATSSLTSRSSPQVRSSLKGHARSASHGSVSGQGSGVTVQSCGGLDRTSAEASRKGHTRAFSHGQILDGVAPHMKSHSRASSKTDFILPPGHQDKENTQSHRLASRTESFQKGHSRQASRSESIYTLRQSTTSILDRLFFCWRKKQGEEAGYRTIVPNHLVPPDTPADQHPNRAFVCNHIRTTKYTLLSFLPKNLFEQFHRFANLYFLFIVLLNWFPAINAFGKEIAMLPVLFVLGVTAVKDLFEDRRRHLSDKRINSYTCRVYSSELGRYTKTKWQDVCVGDLVHLSCNELIPADILLLQSSGENGLCNIETSNLDGETSLKQRQVARGFAALKDTFQPSMFKSIIECDAPTTKIYRFHGTLVHPDGERVPVTKDNLVLRDCILKNADFVEGVVVYSGHETKAMLNNGGPRYKRSRLEQQMNLEVVWCVVILVVLCFIGATGSVMWLSSYNHTVPFITWESVSQYNPPYEGFLTFWTFVIILQVMIPLSLYVTIEWTKLMQVYHIHNDTELYDEKSNKRIECRALNITEELGQVQYVFSDKTGTLTENKMMFRRCTIEGVDYSHPPITADMPQTNRVTGKLGSHQAPVINPRLQEELTQMNVQLLVDGGVTQIRLNPQSRRIQDFFLLLTICNTVVVSKHPHHDEMNASGVIVPNASHTLGDSDTDSPYSLKKSSLLRDTRSMTPFPPLTSDGKLPCPKFLKMLQRPLSPICSSAESIPTDSPAARPRHLQLPPLVHRGANPSRSPTPSPGELRPVYEAESPDELALVDAAYLYNCRLLKRTPHHATISLPGEGLMEFEILHVLPFDAVRKRMSVVLKHPVSQEKVLYCKGADSAIFSRLAATENPHLAQIILCTQQQLNNYARQGLRILVMARRVLSDGEYSHWLHMFREAEISHGNRDKLLSDCYSSLERNMELLGATGIEDRLQEGVPETIAALRRAGIVVWVLTGDKQETAINVAHSCRLFASDMEIIKLNARNKNTAESAIKFHLEQAKKDQASTNRPDTPSSLFSNDSSVQMPSKKKALVVDGKTLTYILDRRSNLQKPFLDLTRHCTSVLCCRTTPLQKAYIIRIVKEILQMRTLAIGDGANDVSMIQTADIGIGISGQEGMQAVMASDFAVSRFKFLQRLLLVHGHWCYDRLARMVLYFFYKNAGFIFTIFWYQLYCGFSGAVMIDQMYLMLYNLFFTSLPPMVVAIYDKDAPAELLLARPSLYKQGRLGEVYRPHSFWVNMADALYQSIAIFFIALAAYHDSDVGIWEFGTTITTSCVFVQLLHMGIETKSWTVIHWMALLVSFLVYFGFAIIYNSLCVRCFGLQNPFWVIHWAMGTMIFWTVLLLTVVVALLPRFIVCSLKSSLMPSDVTRALLARRRAEHGEEFFVSWSRSTSSSSVFRANDVPNRDGASDSLTDVG